MFRLIGFIIGSAAAVSVLFVLVGVPEFHLGSGADDLGRYDAAIHKLKEKQRAAPSAPPPLETAPEPSASPASDDTEQATATVTDRREDPAAPEAMPADAPIADAAAAPLLANGGERLDAAPPAEPSWHSFWNPFRSEIAAAGFVSRLESVTGLDYRVEKVRAGVYEVAFSYESDTELSTRLEQISAATGLDLTDTLP